MWGDSDTLLVGIWLDPNEGDGPKLLSDFNRAAFDVFTSGPDDNLTGRLYHPDSGRQTFDPAMYTANNRYFYYADARERVPEGCGYWQRPIIRYDITDRKLAHLGGGAVSPDGTRLATWQDRELVVWDIDNGEIGRASMAVPNVADETSLYYPYYMFAPG